MKKRMLFNKSWLKSQKLLTSHELIISPGAIVKNQAPHVNFCYSVVLRSYGCRVSEKSGWHFFIQCSRSFGGH